MNRILFLSLFVACGCCRGGTNSIPCELFRSTRAELRPVSLEDHPAQQSTTSESLTLDVPKRTNRDFDIGSGLDPTRLAVDTHPDGFSGALDPQLYHHLDRSGYLTRPSPPSSNLLVRVTDEVFTPEPIRVGKTASFSCTILTAIKRKNPFCLLNPIFLQLSW